MATMSFLNDPPLFDGDCVRFIGTDGEKNFICGVTTYALKHCDPSLPHHGLLPAEAFLPHLKSSWVKFTKRRGPSTGTESSRLKDTFTSWFIARI